MWGRHSLVACLLVAGAAAVVVLGIVDVVVVVVDAVVIAVDSKLILYLEGLSETTWPPFLLPWLPALCAPNTLGHNKRYLYSTSRESWS